MFTRYFYAIEYLDYNVCMDIFEEHGVFYLKPLFKGAMNVALNYDLKFDSTIPKIMGLPELPKGELTFFESIFLRFFLLIR